MCVVYTLYKWVLLWCLSPKTFHMGPTVAVSYTTRCMFSPVWHKVWCWEHSTVAILSWLPQTLSEVDVPHLSVFKPKSEQFLWHWHGSVEEPPMEKWPAGHRSHTVSLTGVPVGDTHRMVLEFYQQRCDFDIQHIALYKILCQILNYEKTSNHTHFYHGYYHKFHHTHLSHFQCVNMTCIV